MQIDGEDRTVWFPDDIGDMPSSEDGEKATDNSSHLGTSIHHIRHLTDHPYIIDELPLDYSILDEIGVNIPIVGWRILQLSARSVYEKSSFCAVARSSGMSRIFTNYCLYGNVSTEHEEILSEQHRMGLCCG